MLVSVSLWRTLLVWFHKENGFTQLFGGEMPQEDPPPRLRQRLGFVCFLVLPAANKCNVRGRGGSRVLRGQCAREGRAVIWDQNTLIPALHRVP